MKLKNRIRMWFLKHSLSKNPLPLMRSLVKEEGWMSLPPIHANTPKEVIKVILEDFMLYDPKRIEAILRQIP